jgi:hypothetical protein
VNALMVVALLSIAAPVVTAADRGTHVDRSRHGHESRGRLRSVPEFDPTAVGVVAALIAGGGLIVARRRSVRHLDRRCAPGPEDR